MENPQYYKEDEIDAMFASFNPPIPTLDEVLNAGYDSDYRIVIETPGDRAIIGNSLHPNGIGVYGYSSTGIGVYASTDEGVGLKSLGKTNSAIFDILGEANINDIVKFQNDGVDKVIIKSDGRISASPATLSNEVVVKSQLDAVTRPYKVYTALLSQSGTNAPTAIVLENTLGGSINWAYNSSGLYIGTLTGSFALNKTVVFITGSFGGVVTNAASTSVNDVTISTVKSDTGIYTNGVMANTTIEIRVYN